MSKKTTAHILTYLGILPFLLAAIASKQYPDLMGLNYDEIILTYGAIIASFIAGSHWGMYLYKDTHINLFIHSNIMALLAWFALVADIPGSEGILLICFFYLLFIDKQVSNAGMMEDWYLRLRIVASTLVIAIVSFHILF